MILAVAGVSIRPKIGATRSPSHLAGARSWRRRTAGGTSKADMVRDAIAKLGWDAGHRRVSTSTSSRPTTSRCPRPHISQTKSNERKRRASAGRRRRGGRPAGEGGTAVGGRQRQGGRHPVVRRDGPPVGDQDRGRRHPRGRQERAAQVTGGGRVTRCQPDRLQGCRRSGTPASPARRPGPGRRASPRPRSTPAAPPAPTPAAAAPPASRSRDRAGPAYCVAASAVRNRARASGPSLTRQRANSAAAVLHPDQQVRVQFVRGGRGRDHFWRIGR